MNTLIFYTSDDYTARSVLDLGPVAPRSSDDLDMQIFNSSPSFQAEDVAVTVAGDDAGQLLLSLDGDSFFRTVTLGDIPPGAVSTVFTVRRVTPSDAAAGSNTAELSAAPAAWSSVADSGTSTNVSLDADVDLDVDLDDITEPPTPEGQ